MKKSTITLIAMAAVALSVAAPAHAGQKKLQSIQVAKVSAERAVVESVFGLKIKAEEHVSDLFGPSSRFFSRGETKTSASVAGIHLDETIYDEEKDIAMATASLTLADVTLQTGIEFPNPDKKFTRVGFGTSSRKHMNAVKAMRAAEVDAYTKLAKEILGYELETHTKVENFVLESDEIKTKMIASVFMADLVEHGWNEDGDAYVTLKIDIGSMEQILGQEFIKSGEVTVTGYGALVQDLADEEEVPSKKGASAKSGVISFPSN